MESDWRYGVAYFGMAYSDWLLCARYAGVLLPPDTVVVRMTGGRIGLFQVPTPESIPITITVSGAPPGGFPWGIPVQAD